MFFSSHEIAFSRAALAGALALEFGSSRAPSEEGACIVGPSVLMNARARQEAAIFDLRAQGRKVPGARDAARFSRAEKRAVFLLGEPQVCARFASNHGLKNYFIVPPCSVEFAPLAGVPQLSPREAREKIERALWPVFDVSQAEEFAASRLPASRGLEFVGFESSVDLPHHHPFIVACRVGHRSQLVVQKLRALGFDARNLNGGLWAWECAGLPLEMGQ